MIPYLTVRSPLRLYWQTKRDGMRRDALHGWVVDLNVRPLLPAVVLSEPRVPPNFVEFAMTSAHCIIPERYP